MAEKQFDVIVVGSGHNQLTAAAYLARSGVSVLVLEKRPTLGGGAVSTELVRPGFVDDVHATGIAHLMSHPIIRSDELGLLSQFGLEVVVPTISFMTIFDDGDTIACYEDLDRTCAEFAKFSQKDADRYREMATFMVSMGPIIGMAMTRPAPSFGGFVAMLERIPQGQDLVLAMLKSAYDVITENFEHPKIQIHFLKWAGETLCGPEDKTTGLNMFFLIGASHSHPAGAIVGGTQRLTDATARCVEHHGGVIRTNANVVRVINQGGVAKSVELEDGEVLTAKKAVVAAIHPHHLGEKVGGLDPALVRRAAATTSSPFSNMVIHAALKEKVQWTTGPEANDCLTANLVDYVGMTEFRKVFDGMKYGILPKHFMTGVLLHSNYDSTRAPAGQHTLYCNPFVPYALEDGTPDGWEDIKEARADWVMERLRHYAPNISGDNILGRKVHSPLDVARHSPSFVNGDFMGLGSYIYQSLGMRPTAELSQYGVPGAEGLYLSGPFMHPGGGITGGGRAVAMRVMDDLGVDYSKVIQS